MEWDHTYAADAADLRERHEEKGYPIPDHLWPPDLMPGNADILEAFHSLNADRPIGLVVGAIPFTAISVFAERIDLIGDEFWFFFNCIRLMDLRWLEITRPKKPAG